MSRRETGSPVSLKVRRNPNCGEEYLGFEKLESQESFKVMTREEIVQEASKPLYLRRYE